MVAQDINDVLNKVINDMGFVIFGSSDDINLQDYIVDSMQFIDFIVRLENELHMELPDDFLDYDLLASSYAFVLKIEQCFIKTNHDEYKI